MMDNEKYSLGSFIIKYFLLAFVFLSLGFCVGQSFIDFLNLVYIKFQMNNLFEFDYMNVRESFPAYFAIVTQVLGLSIYIYKVLFKSNNKLMFNLFKNSEIFFWIFIILLLGEVFIYCKDLILLTFEKYYLIFGFDRLILPCLFIGIYYRIKSCKFKNWYNLNKVIVKDFCKFWWGYCIVNLLPIFLFWIYLNITDFDEGGFSIFGVLAFGLFLMVLLQFFGLILYILIVYKNNQNLYTQKILKSNFMVFKIWVVLVLIDILIYNLSTVSTNQIWHNAIVCLYMWGCGRFIFPLMVVNFINILRKKFKL